MLRCPNNIQQQHPSASVKTKRTLILRECEITDEGAEALGQALAENESLEELDLQQLGDSGTNPSATRGER